jgi:hypothetical protein
MSHRICTSVEAAEVPTFQSPLNRSSFNSQQIELPAADDPVLSLRKVSDRVIDPNRRCVAGPPRRPMRSAFCMHGMANALLVGHTTDAAIRARAYGAYFGPNSPPPGKQKRPQSAVAASGFDPFK